LFFLDSLAGVSACCLPLPPNDIWRPSPGEISLNPFAPTDYLGGAFMLAFNYNQTSSKITGRAFAGRIAFGKTKTVAARTIGGVTRIVWGGYLDLSDGAMWTADALQGSPGYGARDGWLMVNWPGNEAAVAAATKPLSTYVTGFPARVNTTSSVTANIRNVKIMRINATNLDGDSSTLDARFIHPWSETDPLTPRTGYAPSGNVSYIYNGVPFYGGMVLDIANVNDSTRLRTLPGATWYKGNSGFTDTPWIQFGTSLLGGEKTFLRTAIFAYTRELYNGTETDRYSFDTKSSLTFIMERFAVWSLPSYKICMSKNVRFIVRNGQSDWYVSERVLGWMGEGPAQWGYHIISFTSSSDDGRWAAWNPATADALKFDPTTATFLSVDFQNVQAVGFLIVDDDWFEFPWTKPVPGSDPPYYLSPSEQFTGVGDSLRFVRFEAQMVKNAPTNRLPVAQFTMNTTTLRVGDAVLVDATSSYDPDGFISFTTWDFGDGTQSSGPTETKIYTVAGTYTIEVTVADGLRELSSQVQRIYVLPPNISPSNFSSVAAGWWGAYASGYMDCVGVDGCGVRDPYRGLADLDNDDSNDDYYLSFPLAGPERPLYQTSGTKLIGGFRFESQNTNSSFTSWVRLTQAGHNNPVKSPLWDSNGVRAWTMGWDASPSTTNFTRFAVLFAIDKSEFVGGADQSVVSFDSNSVLYAGPWNALGRFSQWLRFAVRDGNQWFVSEYFYRPNTTIDFNQDSNTGYGNSSSVPPTPPSPIMTLADPNGASRWVAWNPATSLFAPTSGYNYRVFSDVTAFGVTAQLPDWTFTRNSTIAQFSNFRMAGLWMQASFNLGSVAAPIARLSASPTQANLPAPISFDASATTSGAAIRDYRWDFGDGVVATTPAATTLHSYSVSGVFTASVTVRDELDRSSTVSVTITITDPNTGAVGSEINFIGESNVLVREGDTRSFLVSRTGDNLGTVSVSFRFDHISTDSSDIIGDLKRLSWGSGDVAPKNVSIQFRMDDGTEPSEQFRLILAEPYGGAKLGSSNIVTIQILDSSAAPGAVAEPFIGAAPKFGGAPDSSALNSVGGPNVAGIVVGTLVAVALVAAAIGVAVWKRDLIRAKLFK
jgi:hypothetical protein